MGEKVLEWAYACLERGLRIGVIGYQRGRTFGKNKNGITEGVIWKQLLLFFFPILIGYFFSAVV